MRTIQRLYESLNERKRPEDIAKLVLDLLRPELNSREQSLLKKAANKALTSSNWGYTSMSQTFRAPVGAYSQISKAAELFDLEPPSQTECEQPEQILAFIEQTSPLINKEVRKNNFVADRLNKMEREAEGMELSKRQYNKRWRLLKRLEKKLATIEFEARKAEFEKIAKHGLSHRLEFESFSSDVNTACFIAYFNARCNLRSEFTISGQQNPFDEIAEMLFKRCKGKPAVFWEKGKATTQQSKTNWLAMAKIYPTKEVLPQLTDEEKGQMLGEWTSVLEELAGLLEDLWQKNKFIRKTMIVQRGNDSTTWNSLAGAWNKARDSWMNIIYALGMQDVMEDVCFGKAMRLMAADVVSWHQSEDGDLDPNTYVWSKLPLPWQVFNGKKECNQAMIEKACFQANLDPWKSGWLAPKRIQVAAYRPTPELVHGVAVSSPFLATVLKKNRYYSGKKGRPIDPRNN